MKLKGEFHELNTRYVSEGIGDNYMRWKTYEQFNSSTNVFIESPTGTGKTSFLIDALLPYAIKMNRSIIYVCNRALLKKQTEKYINESSYGLTRITKENDKISILSYPDYTADIRITTYQSITKLNTKMISNLFYVVFDEAHFFLEDSLFNVNTYNIFKFILESFKAQVRIFMSATLKEFSEIYINSYRFCIPDHPQKEIYEHFYTYNYDYYHNYYSSPIYNLVLYKDDESLINKIKNNSTDKWLIFVSSVNNGLYTKKYIETLTKKKCCFLTAKDKNSATWKRLIDKSCFKQDVLIATKVIDNGVNIHDDMVKNIVLPFTNRTEFLQMIGRKRISNNSPINIYVKLPSVHTVSEILKAYKKKLDFLNVILQKQKNSYKKRLVRDFWRSEEYNRLFCYSFSNDKVKLSANHLAVLKLIHEIELYEFLLNTSANTQAYIDCLITWLGNSIVSINNEKINSNANNLVDYLNENLNRPISDTVSFYESFLELYKMFCYNLFKRREPENEEKYKKSLSIRKGRTQRKATINRCLDFLELPYKLKKEKNCWILNQLP